MLIITVIRQKYSDDDIDDYNDNNTKNNENINNDNDNDDIALSFIPNTLIKLLIQIISRSEIFCNRWITTGGGSKIYHFDYTYKPRHFYMS